MLHGGPGSSAGLEPLIAALAPRRVVAPDMMGNGASDPPPSAPTDIGFYADCVVALLDALGIEHGDFYGHHTGAQVACEIAVRHPGRVDRLVLDGVALFSDVERAEFAERYAPPIVPAEDGAQLSAVWDFVRHITRYFPHYRRDVAHAIDPPIAVPLGVQTALAGEILGNWPTFHLSYQAAFRHDVRSLLPSVEAPAMVLRIEGDPLACHAADAASLIQDATIVDTSRAGRSVDISAFLNASSSK